MASCLEDVEQSKGDVLLMREGELSSLIAILEDDGPNGFRFVPQTKHEDSVQYSVQWKLSTSQPFLPSSN